LTKIKKQGSVTLSKFKENGYEEFGIFFGIYFFVLGISCNTQSSVSLAKFKERFNEIKNDDMYDGSIMGALYAASSVSLAKFKERFNEIKNDAVYDGSAMGALYAAR
jgi:hypothetical protein